MKLILPEDWKLPLSDALSSENFKGLSASVSSAYSQTTCFPPSPQIFEAFKLCHYSQVKVVLLGQDPYHRIGQAHGLSFSVPAGQKFPPSLRNVFKELLTDLPGYEVPLSGDLSQWAQQGVLLLNSILTVQSGLPGSHKGFGWESFTDQVISTLSADKEHLVFLLWGNFAISKSTLIDASKHLILKAAHPSPLARGAFFGSKHFSQTNAYLKSQGLAPINWQL
jgi:uracil-DNA glycosylase